MFLSSFPSAFWDFLGSVLSNRPGLLSVVFIFPHGLSLDHHGSLLSCVYKQGRFYHRDVCKVRTQEAENFDEEVKSLVSAWRALLYQLYGLNTA